MNTLPEYRYSGGRTMVNLHSQYLQEFLAVWKKAKVAELDLPETDHPGYVSLEALLAHVLGAARHYMIWMTDKLELPDPMIDQTPALDVIETETDDYLAYLIKQWRTPLSQVEEERFDRPEHESSWGTRYCIDAMLEHAVMHPILHRVQLQELLEQQTST
jgi:uncharacterized damage-inducible protein DinB